MPTDFQKAEIIVKHSGGMSNKEISENMDLHVNVISFWINRFYKTNSLTNKKRTGRKRKTTKEQGRWRIKENKIKKFPINTNIRICLGHLVNFMSIASRLAKDWGHKNILIMLFQK